jgi:hypothetical protein
MPGDFDSAGPPRIRFFARSRIAFRRSDAGGALKHPPAERHTQPTDTSVQRFVDGLAAASTWLGARVVRYSFPVRLLHSRLCTGLSRRYPDAGRPLQSVLEESLAVETHEAEQSG